MYQINLFKKSNFMYRISNLKILLFVIGSNKWLHLLYEISKADPVFCPNKCGRCYRGEQRRGHLKRHLDTECGVPKKFPCVICLKRFSQKWSLKKHRALVHKVLV